MRAGTLDFFGFEIGWRTLLRGFGWCAVIALLALNVRYTRKAAAYEDETGKAVIAQTEESQAELDRLTQTVFVLRADHASMSRKIGQMNEDVKALARAWNVKLPE